VTKTKPDTVSKEQAEENLARLAGAPAPNLNDEQRAAVEYGDGPLLIVAGAGTGKTTVITERIVHLIKEQGVPGHRIAAMTFTDKAAREMEDRLYDRLSFTEASMRVGTFHSFGRYLIERYGQHLGRGLGGRLIKRPEQVVLLRDRLERLPLDKLAPRTDPTGQLDGILNVISRLKNEDVSPETFQKWVKSEQKKAAKLTDPELKAAREAELVKHGEVAGAYAAYEQFKLEENLVDYDDQLTLPLELLREHPDVLADVRKTFTHVLVDEFQDTNVIQAELAYLIAGKNGNLTVVGDDDQSIYAFRGAALSNILDFEKQYPKAQLIVLRQNYRSTQNILDAAYRMIRHNDPHRLEAADKFDKRLTAIAGEGPEITYWQHATIDDEADRVAELIAAQKKEGMAYKDMAVLVPEHRDAEPFRQSLTAAGIPVTLEQREYLYRQPEIKLAVAALRVIDNPLHSSSLRVLATSDLYGMPEDDYAKLERTEHRSRLSVWEQLGEMDAKAALRLREDIERFRKLTESNTVGEVLYAYLVEHLGYFQRLSGDVPGDNRPIERLSSFCTALKRYADTAKDPSVHSWLQYYDHIADLSDEIESDSDGPDVPDAVPILTMHNSKGLEFELVVLAALIKDRLPGTFRPGFAAPQELLRDPVDKEAHIREKRRLFYVALTRAKRKLYLTFPHNVGGKRDALKPSPFLEEALGERIPAPLPETASAAKHKIDRLRRARDLPGEYQVPDPLELSHSSLDSFRTCPWRYYWDYHVKVYLPPAHQLLYGDAIHNVIRDTNRAVMDGKPLTAAAVRERLEKYWRGEGYLNRKLHDEAWQRALRTVEAYRGRSAKEDAPSHIEEDFRFKLSNCYVKGRYDRIDELPDGTVRILDYKTSDVATLEDAEKKLKTERNKKQLQLYALAYRHQTGKIPDEVGLVFPEHGITVTTKPTAKQLDTLEQEITGIAQRIIDGDLRHNPSKHECSRAASNRCPTNTERNRGDFTT
jgi:DNA helicase-2/ATP-dependent DNA helicase PcrA